MLVVLRHERPPIVQLRTLGCLIHSSQVNLPKFFVRINFICDADLRFQRLEDDECGEDLVEPPWGLV